MDRLAQARGDGRVVWALANEAMGKKTEHLCPPIGEAGGSVTEDAHAAAEVFNPFFINKVKKLDPRSHPMRPPPPYTL